jgi:prepilin-type N-terminal cleavage/methylation domain-containing protein
MTTKQNKGFTLLEILLVIAAIGILAAIVLVAINPNRQLAQARNAQRRADINTIYKALEQYLIDNGSYPNSINSNYKEICNTGTEQVGGATDCSGKADLRVLVPTYLAAIPTDPSGGEYRVGINILNNRISIEATGVESGQSIVINFPTEFDADALAYITAVETADTQALEDNVKIAINNFVVGLKTDGIWEPIKASVIMAGARTLNGALVPLKGPVPTNFNFVAGDYNRKTGLVGNRSTKYLNSNRNNNADPQNSNHNAAYITNTGAIGGAVIAGGVNSTGDNYIDLISGLGGTRHTNRRSGNTLSGSYTTGLAGTSRSTSTEYSFRVPGASGARVVDSEPPSSRVVTVFSRNGGAEASSDHRLAFYSIGESLDLALLDARVTQLMTDYANAIP